MDMNKHKKTLFTLLMILLPVIFLGFSLILLKGRTSVESDYEREVVMSSEFYAKLENLPQGIAFPAYSRNQIHYDSDRKLLVFKGIMDKEQKDDLLRLSQDKSYRDAIEFLYVGCLNFTDLRARAPYVMFRPTPGKGGINSLGFNSPEISNDKKPNEYRIAMVGGSVVFTGGHDSTIVAYLAKILKERDPRLKDKEITYINAGISSAVSGQELAQLIYNVLPLNIDLLVVFDGYNDFYCPFNYDRRPGYPYDYIVEEYRYYKFNSEKKWWDTFSSLFDTGLFRKSTPKIVHDYYEELGIKKPTMEEATAQTVDIYFRNITYMATIANAFGVKVAVFLQPYSPKHNKVNPERPETGSLMKVYGMARERFRELAKGNSPNRIYYDTVPMGLTTLREMFTDGAHFPEEANRMMAEEMYFVMKKERMVD